jgi:diaminopimelate decarboxylase
VNTRRLGPATPAVLVHDLDALGERVRALQAAFPPGTLHAVAVKALPLVEVLRRLVEAGCGLEAASWEEVALARAAGCPPGRVVYDSPAKTAAQLEGALAMGARVNADGLQELERIDALARAGTPVRSVGLRINPGVEGGRIAAVSVGGPRSRFGVPLADGGAAVIDAFRRYPWLDGLHVHVGSQGMPLRALAAGAARAAALAAEIESNLGPGRVAAVDLGGGLPATYSAQAPAPGLHAFVEALRAEAPALLSGRWRLITELGRALHAPCGWAISRVEYTRELDGAALAVLHVGADLLLRTAYRPEDWPHEALVLDAGGELRRDPPRPTTLAGPLCFAGDIIARERLLPAPRAGDLCILRDTGAYTLSMWSRHCSRGIPAVWGFERGDWTLLRRGEAPEDVVRFWSRGD